MTDLQRRIVFTLGALAVYRLGTHIPIPGIDIGFLNSIVGGGKAVSGGIINDVSSQLPVSLSIFSLGIIPYLTAAVLMRLASAVSLRLRALENHSFAGQQRVIRVTRLIAVLIAGMAGYGVAIGLDRPYGMVTEPGPTFRLMAFATTTTGFVAILWLSDQITRRGVGNGVALILFSDIAVEIPGILVALERVVSTRELTLGLAIVLLMASVAVVAGIVFIERSVRHVWVQFPRQEFASQSFRGAQASIPLKLNNGGIIPAMIATWVLIYIFRVVSFFLSAQGNYDFQGWMFPDHPTNVAVTAALIIAMVHIYGRSLLDPKDLASQLQRRNAIVLDRRPGPETEAEFRRLLRGLSHFGAVYLAVIFLLPAMTYAASPQMPGWIGGIGSLIVTAVAIDTLNDLAHRWTQEHRRPPVDEGLRNAIAIAMNIPDQPRIRAPTPIPRKLSEADR